MNVNHNYVDIVDEFIAEFGVDRAFHVGPYGDFAKWLRTHHGEYYVNRASQLMQHHKNSKAAGYPSRYVLERNGWGQGAFWFAMKPEDAISSSMRAATENMDRLKADHMTRAMRAVEKGDAELQRKWIECNARYEIARQIMEDAIKRASEIEAAA